MVCALDWCILDMADKRRQFFFIAEDGLSSDDRAALLALHKTEFYPKENPIFQRLCVNPSYDSEFPVDAMITAFVFCDLLA